MPLKIKLKENAKIEKYRSRVLFSQKYTWSHFSQAMSCLNPKHTLSTVFETHIMLDHTCSV